MTLYGMPQIEESLVWSWDRVRKSVAWRACREEHPDFAKDSRNVRLGLAHIIPIPLSNQYEQVYMDM